MNALPHGWNQAPLEFFAASGTPIVYGVIQPGNVAEGGVPLVRVCDIVNGAIAWPETRTISGDINSEYQRSLLLNGDILISVVGTIGRIGWVTNVPPIANIARALALLRVDARKVNPRWIYHCLHTEKIQWCLSQEAREVARKTLNLEQLRAVEVPLPPKPEQTRIVAKIDRLIARSTRARHELDLIPKLIERYKQAILAKAFSGELTADWRASNALATPVKPRQIRNKRTVVLKEAFEPPFMLPRSWNWHRLPEIGELDRGKSRHRPRNDKRLFGGSYPFIQTGEIRASDRYLTQHEQTLSEFGLEQSRLWPAGTICITIAANIAETAILAIDACFPDSVVGFTVYKECTTPEYFEYFVRTIRADLERFAPATAQKNINLEILNAVHAPTPPLAEQLEIVRRIDTSFAWLDKIRIEHTRAAHLLPKLDQAILAKAFRGELVPQDPNDEPASVLLARVRADKGDDKPRRRRSVSS